MNAQICDPLLLPFAGNVLSRLDDGQREHLMERSAILASEAGLQPPALCDALALLEVLRLYPAALTGLVALEIELDGATQWLLTTDLDQARDYLRDIGGTEIAVLDPADVIRAQYGGLALLGTLG